MDINWTTYILLMLISIPMTLLFERLMNYLGYWVAEKFYKQDKGVEKKGALIGILFSLSMSLLFGGILMLKNGCLIIAVLLFIFALLGLGSMGWLIICERHRIARIEQRE